MSNEPQKSDHAQFAPVISSDEGERTPEFVLGSGRVYLLTKADRRLVRWITGAATVLFIVIGSFIKASDLPFGKAMLILGGAFVIIPTAACFLLWVHLKLGGVPSVAVPKSPVRLSLRPDPDAVIWGFSMVCGASALAVLVWLFVLGEDLAHHTFEAKLLFPLWMFLAPLICAVLGFRWARRKFRKNDQT